MQPSVREVWAMQIALAVLVFFGVVALVAFPGMARAASVPQVPTPMLDRNTVAAVDAFLKLDGVPGAVSQKGVYIKGEIAMRKAGGEQNELLYKEYKCSALEVQALSGGSLIGTTIPQDGMQPGSCVFSMKLPPGVRSGILQVNETRAFGSGGGAGKVKMQDISVTKTTDSSSPKLYVKNVGRTSFSFDTPAGVSQSASKFELNGDGIPAIYMKSPLEINAYLK
jgi:hypothetical protein